MAIRELTERAMALPLAEWVHLAEALWHSIGEGLRVGSEREAIDQAARPLTRPFDQTTSFVLTFAVFFRFLYAFCLHTREQNRCQNVTSFMGFLQVGQAGFFAHFIDYLCSALCESRQKLV